MHQTLSHIHYLTKNTITLILWSLITSSQTIGNSNKYLAVSAVKKLEFLFGIGKYHACSNQYTFYAHMESCFPNYTTNFRCYSEECTYRWSSNLNPKTSKINRSFDSFAPIQYLTATVVNSFPRCPDYGISCLPMYFPHRNLFF